MKIEELMLEMRDGIRLQCFIYFPAEKGPFPALLARCTYGHTVVDSISRSWVKKGYAVVLQNIRGRHESEGGPVTRNSHPEDGYDTIEWIINQPWSNQLVGTFGRSALAKVQVQTAFLAHPAHRAMAPEVLPYGFMSRLGGAFLFSQVPQWMYLAQSGTELGKYEADCIVCKKKSMGPVPQWSYHPVTMRFGVFRSLIFSGLISSLMR